MDNLLFSGTYNDIEQIGQSTRALLEKDLPKDDLPLYDYLKKVVNFLGGETLTANSPDVFQEQGGSLEIFKDDKFKISLSPLTSPIRDNFTIAHELGHYFLHFISKKENYFKKNPEKKSLIFHRYGSGKLEIQANRFAAAFTMPKDEFIKYKKKYKSAPFLLSAHFEISVPAVEVRLKYI